MSNQLKAHLHPCQRQLVQPCANSADRLVVACKHQPPVFGKIYALRRPQRGSFQSEVRDVGGDRAQIPLVRLASLEQPLGQGIRLSLRLTVGDL